MRPEVLEPDRHRVLRRDRPSPRHHADGRAGFPDHVGQRVRRAHARRRARADRRPPGARHRGGQRRPRVRVRLHVEDHLRGRWGGVLRGVTRQPQVVAGRHEQADHRSGQNQPPPARDVPARHGGRRRAHAQAPRDHRAEVRRAVAHPHRELRRHPWRFLVHAGGRLLRHAAGARRLRVGGRAAGEGGGCRTTHPYGKDPEDAIIRLATTFPVLDEVEKAMAGVTVCVRLALAQRS